MLLEHNEQYKRMRKLMGLNESTIDLVESKNTESQSLAILKKANIGDSDNIQKIFINGDKSTNQKNLPIMAHILTTFKVDANTVVTLVNEYNGLADESKIKPIELIRGGVKIGDKIFNDFIRLSEYIHGEIARHHNSNKSSSVSGEFKAEIKPMWSGNNIDIYKGDSVGKCVKYTGGALTGRAYSFCIGQPANGMYKSYRDSKNSSFYFIVDRNRFKVDSNGNVDLSDPLHIVVFDNTKYGIELTDANNTTGTIAEFGDNTDEYIKYLKSHSVPVESLTNKPKTEQERYEDNLLGNQNEDLKWFMYLDYPNRPDYRKPELESGESAENYYKSAYIGRGHLLSNDQFDYLMGK